MTELIQTMGAFWTAVVCLCALGTIYYSIENWCKSRVKVAAYKCGCKKPDANTITKPVKKSGS